MERPLERLISVVDGGADDSSVTPAERMLAAELTALEREEGEVSALRRKLHERLASFPNPLTLDRERELSVRRRELHRRIDLIRVELHMLGWERSG